MMRSSAIANSLTQPTCHVWHAITLPSYTERGPTQWENSASWSIQGGATAYLRQRWNLNAVLGHQDKKERADHRHHAINALVVALTGPREVQLLSRAAQQAESLYDDRLFVPVDPPWAGFLDEAFRAVDRINVSSRVCRKLNGQLHKATIFSKPIASIHENDNNLQLDKNGQTDRVHHVRKGD